MGFFRKLFILQLVELVLTYNFTGCDFSNITQEYDEVIYLQLKPYENKKFNNYKYCENRLQCLTEIVNRTFSLESDCSSPSNKTAELTEATLAKWCPHYSRSRINNTQTMKKSKKREVAARKCQKEILQIIALWRHFIHLLEDPVDQN